MSITPDAVRRRSRSIPVFVFVISFFACGESTRDPFAVRESSPGEGSFRLVDEKGRELLLHGVNARVEGVFDVTFDDGRIALEEIPAFGEDDCRFLGEELGLDHLRLPVNWSGIEPHDDDFREDYVDRVLAIAAACERHGVYTLVDFHQDAFSKEIGEDGAPLWAIDPPPTMLLEGPLTDLTERRTSAQVLDAFETFFSNAHGNWDQYAEMAAWVAERIDGKPGIVGLEIMNEPHIVFDDDTLVAFHHAMTSAIRRVAPRMTVFFEPAALRNLSDFDAVSPAFDRSDAVYAPHLYTDVFETGWADEDETAVNASADRMRVEADLHGAALYVGEFGHDDTDLGAHFVTTAMEAMDRNVASWAYWLYEERSQGSWGLYDASGVVGQRGILREARADLLARAYPVAIDGHVASFAYDATARTLRVDLERAGGGEHVLAAPTRTYPAGAEVRCDGTVVDATVAAGRATFRCRGARIDLAPLP